MREGICVEKRLVPMGRAAWLVVWLGVFVLTMLPQVGSAPIATAQGTINLTANGSSGSLTLPQGEMAYLAVSGLSPSATFGVYWYTGGGCGVGLAGSQGNLLADESGAWNGTLDSVPVTPTTWWVRVDDGVDRSNCVAITWSAVISSPTTVPTQVPPTAIPPSPTQIPPTPTLEPSPTPDLGPLGLTVNGGPGPLISRAGDTALLQMTGLQPGVGFALRLSNQPTCTAEYVVISFNGNASTTRLQEVGVFGPNQSYSYLVVQGTRTSNCVTITIPPTATVPATNTAEPTAATSIPTTTVEPTATSTSTTTATTTPEATAMGTTVSTATTTPNPTATNPPDPTATTTPVPQSIVLMADGSLGPLTVPVGTSLALVGTGLTANGPFTHATYGGGDCGLGLITVQDLVADAAGEWIGGNLSSSTPVTWWIRVTDGPNNSNCVEITWDAGSATNTPVVTATATATSTATATLAPTSTATAAVTSTPAPSATSTPTATSVSPGTVTPTEMVTATMTMAPIDPTPTATSPVSALPSTGGSDNGASPGMLGVLLGMSLALLVLAVIQVDRKNRSR